MCVPTHLHILESLGSTDRGFSVVRDRVNWLKLSHWSIWTNGAGWVKPTSYEVMKMKMVNHKPMIYLEGRGFLQGGEEVRWEKLE
jgi:putative transposase